MHTVTTMSARRPATARAYAYAAFTRALPALALLTACSGDDSASTAASVSASMTSEAGETGETSGATDATTGFGSSESTVGATTQGGATSEGTTTQGEPTTTAGPELEPAPTETLEYTPTDEIFPNPERGVYRYVEITEGWDLQGLADDGTRLVYSYVRLDDYRAEAIAQSLLDELDAGLDDARSAGLKVILRFAYNAGPYPDSEPDAPLDRVLQHIEQVAPVLAAHEDVIALVQAGFIGAWGEWHTSTNDLLPHKGTILSALLAAIPPSRSTQIRYPLYKDELYGAALVEREAHDGGEKARVGHHNDCFLASDTDQGTYPSDQIEQWKQFVEDETAFVPMGGETCLDNPPRSECPTALEELARFHYSFINYDYHPAVIASWQDGGCYDTIERLLGYRLQLVSADLAPVARPGGVFPLRVELTNQGWAAPFNPRPVELVLSGPGGEYRAALAEDPRRWYAGKPRTIAGALLLPSDMSPGTYELSLALPDASPALASRPEYSIRLANEGVWQSGRNLLGAIEIDPDGPGGAAPDQAFGFVPD